MTIEEEEVVEKEEVWINFEGRSNGICSQIDWVMRKIKNYSKLFDLNSWGDGQMGLPVIEMKTSNREDLWWRGRWCVCLYLPIYLSNKTNIIYEIKIQNK